MSTENLQPKARPWPGEKLLDPKNYGGDEYVVIFLISFVVFVMFKHLIFHTLYFWWFGSARFYIPRKFWTTITGKTFTDRLYIFIKAKLSKQDEIKARDVADQIALYCRQKEFAPNTGEEKGKVLTELLQKTSPKSVLLYRPNCGYVIMKVLESLPDDGHVYIIEPEVEYVTFTKQIMTLIKEEKKLTVLNDDFNAGISELKSNYVNKLDFIFLNRTGFEQKSHMYHVKELEKQQMLKPGTVLLADKVVHIGDAEFLKYVRGSECFATKYYQMPLENSPDEIVDAMESAVYTG